MRHRSPQQIQRELRDAYRDIAKDFSETRRHHWPEFKYFSQWIPEGSKVLDIGCGNGRFFGYLREQKKIIDYTGVDFCPELLDIARKNYPQQEFVEQNMTELELPKRFDRIISIAAFHHLPGKKLRLKALKKMFAHLEDDGLLLISVWNLWQWKYASSFSRAFLDWIASGFRNSPFDLSIPFGKKKTQRYYHAFFPFELKHLLRKSGFAIEDTKVSRFNYLFVCRKNILSVRGNPLFIDQKNVSFEKSSLTA